jgi:hypothetical protein
MFGIDLKQIATRKTRSVEYGARSASAQMDCTAVQVIWHPAYRSASVHRVGVLLLMVIFTVGMTHISDEESTEPKVPYYLGIALGVGAWLLVSFIL